MTKNCINGIDVDGLQVMRDLIQTDGDGLIARPQYQATVIWNNGYHTTSCVTDGQKIIGDEPEQYGGGGAGLTPQDMLLSAIGHCLTATYIGGLSAAGITVKHLQLSVSGRVNFRSAFGLETGNPGFENIGITVDIRTDSSPEDVKEILTKLLKTAPIPDTIIRPVPLDIEIICKENERNSEFSPSQEGEQR